jgi:alkanesulfonate monooxygenase SsuD/methylene tetrahydromethanopterin reductase-like flavin-dependent oxidoreductase (luciferase family)
MGASARTPGQSLESLEEVIVILRAWWSTTGVLRFHGHHYALEGARPGPMPAHPIGIWLGAARPRALALTGRKADGWAAPLIDYLPPAQAAEAQEAIDRAAREARRDPASIRRIYNVPGAFTTRAPARAGDTDKSSVGPPDRDFLRTFIEDVVPDVRERVAAARAQAEPVAATAAGSSQ